MFFYLFISAILIQGTLSNESAEPAAAATETAPTVDLTPILSAINAGQEASTAAFDQLKSSQETVSSTVTAIRTNQATMSTSQTDVVSALGVIKAEQGKVSAQIETVKSDVLQAVSQISTVVQEQAGKSSAGSQEQAAATQSTLQSLQQGVQNLESSLSTLSASVSRLEAAQKEQSASDAGQAELAAKVAQLETLLVGIQETLDKSSAASRTSAQLLASIGEMQERIVQKVGRIGGSSLCELNNRTRQAFNFLHQQVSVQLEALSADAPQYWAKVHELGTEAGLQLYAGLTYLYGEFLKLFDEACLELSAVLVKQGLEQSLADNLSLGALGALSATLAIVVVYLLYKLVRVALRAFCSCLCYYVCCGKSKGKKKTKKGSHSRRHTSSSSSSSSKSKTGEKKKVKQNN